MKEFNLVFRRQPKLFDKKTIKCNKIECIIPAKSLKSAFMIGKQKAKNDQLLKGFMLIGVQTIKLLVIVFLLSGCYSVKQWQKKKVNPCIRIEYNNPARFFSCELVKCSPFSD